MHDRWPSESENVPQYLAFPKDRQSRDIMYFYKKFCLILVQVENVSINQKFCVMKVVRMEGSDKGQIEGDLELCSMAQTEWGAYNNIFI